MEAAGQRSPLTGHEGKSGATLERVVLADGSRLIVKRLSAANDLMMRLLGADVGKEYVLWSAGVLDDLPDGVGHAVVDGWVDGDTTVLVMRDLGNAVLTWERHLTRAQCRRVLTATSAMHRRWLGDPPDGLTPLPDLLGLFAPTRIAAHGVSDNPLAALVLRGWEIFVEWVSPDVAEPVLDLLGTPEPLATALGNGPMTLVHGDLATVNIAFERDQVTLLDWGMPAAAPAAFDLARLLAGCASVLDLSREEVIDDFRRLAGPAHDETSLRLGLLSALVWLGWNKALDAAEHPDPAIRSRERADLDWWVGHARNSLQSGDLG